MAETIRANYEALERIADQFVNAADGTEQMLNRLRTTVDDLQGGGWIGEAANDFYTEMEDEIFPAISRLVEALAAGSETSKRIVTTIRQADEEARSFFVL